MSSSIIGQGTWHDKEALDIIKRERKLGRSLGMIRTEMGLAASGIPHVGNLSDAVRAYGITLALREQGYESEMIAFCDDKDGLRKVPTGMPSSLKKYIGFPVLEIPDPFKCHDSYGSHMTTMLLEALDTCGIDYRFISGAEAYAKGLFKNEIRTILLNAKRVGEIVKDEVGQQKFVEALPYFAICGNCGRIYTTKAVEFLPKEDKILYCCEGMEIKKKWLEGCGHKGEVNYTKGEGKLNWKSEFAVRWKALDIRFEPYGKDLIDSVRTSDRICQEILGFQPPTHIVYEHFLDQNGRKISKSEGVRKRGQSLRRLPTPQLWFRYGSPQSLHLLMLKRSVGAKRLGIADIPNLMEELDELEDAYFGKGRIGNEKQHVKAVGMYKYCWLMKPPAKPGIHAPYRLLVNLASVAPQTKKTEFILTKLRDYGFRTDKASDDLKRRLQYALNWTQDFKKTRKVTVRLTKQQREAVSGLIETLQAEANKKDIQTAIFDLARKHGMPPSQFFRILYTILLGTEQGPPLGRYIIDVGKQNVVEALETALKNTASKAARRRSGA